MEQPAEEFQYTVGEARTSGLEQMDQNTLEAGQYLVEAELQVVGEERILRRLQAVVCRPVLAVVYMCLDIVGTLWAEQPLWLGYL